MATDKNKTQLYLIYCQRIKASDFLKWKPFYCLGVRDCSEIYSFIRQYWVFPSNKWQHFFNLEKIYSEWGSLSTSFDWFVSRSIERGSLLSPADNTQILNNSNNFFLHGKAWSSIKNEIAYITKWHTDSYRLWSFFSAVCKSRTALGPCGMHHYC